MYTGQAGWKDPLRMCGSPTIRMDTWTLLGLNATVRPVTLWHTAIVQIPRVLEMQTISFLPSWS